MTSQNRDTVSPKCQQWCFFAIFSANFQNIRKALLFGGNWCRVGGESRLEEKKQLDIKYNDRSLLHKGNMQW